MKGAERIVIAQLRTRIDSLRARSTPSPTATLAADLDAIRRLADANGFTAITPVVHVIEAALARGARGAVVASGLALLDDAVHCHGDDRSAKVLAAACSLRMGG